MSPAERRRWYEREAKHRLKNLESLVRYLDALVEDGTLAWLRAADAARWEPRWEAAARRLHRQSDAALTLVGFARAQLEADVTKTVYCRCGFPSPHPQEGEFHHGASCPRALRLRVLKEEA